MSTHERVFIAGWCRRCGAAYIAATPDAANGACGAYCAKKLRRRDPATSDWRARQKYRERVVAEALAAGVGRCPRCGKRILDLVSVQDVIARLAREAGGAPEGQVEAYPCPSGFGLHVRNRRRNKHRQKARWRANKKARKLE